MPHDARAGTVILVGAGPGPADLLTVRALRAIEGAQAVLYDALVSDEVVALAPIAALRIRTGKRAGKTSMDQRTINALMLRLALRGLTVIRLKGGDPSIFGRSSEEADYLRGHDVAVEIIPGITAASAAAAQFGFSLTERGVARRLVFATGQITEGALSADGWTVCADVGATVVLYMARDVAALAADNMIRHGRSGATPAVAIENAGGPAARMLSSTLRCLGHDVEAAEFTGPVVLMVGPAVKRARASDPWRSADDFGRRRLG